MIDSMLPLPDLSLDPLRSVDPNDACSRNRCLDLIFRTETGYLPVRADVDLTAQTVAVHGSQQ